MAELRAVQVWRWPRLAAIKNLRVWLLVITTVGLSWALLLGSVNLSLRTSSTRVLGPYSGSASLDYSSRPGSVFAPLTSAFIGRILPGAALAVPTSGTSRGGNNTEASRTSRLVVEHPFDNDHFQNARDISSIPFTAKTNSAGSTRQDGEPTDCALVGGTVWYRYRPSADDVISITTVGTNYSTSLGVFAGTSFGSLRNVGCDSSESGDSWVTFVGRAGTTYFVQVTGPVSGGGNLSLSVDLNAPGSLTSVTHDGVSGNLWSDRPSISADARFVLFNSQASNLVEGDTNDSTDVFVRDRLARTTRTASLGWRGDHPESSAFPGIQSMSGDGRFVTFESWARNLVPEDTNGIEDIFVRDLTEGKTFRVSVSSAGEQGIHGRIYINPFVPAPAASISADGRFVAFHTWHRNLVPNDTNYCPEFGAKGRYQASSTGCPDIFVRDMLLKTTTRISVSSSGAQGNNASYVPVISANGRYVSFYSEASNLVTNDTNGTGDIFVHDRLAGQTTRVSISSRGEQASETKEWIRTSISADGRFVAYSSDALNLVPSDTNGTRDLFVHDRRFGVTTRFNVSSSGEEATPGSDSRAPSLSPEGHYVAFSSDAANLVPNDNNGTYDVFLHDLFTRNTWRLSVTESAQEGNGGSYSPSLSADGRFVAFSSSASNFVSWDRNNADDIFVFPLKVFR